MIHETALLRKESRRGRVEHLKTWHDGKTPTRIRDGRARGIPEDIKRALVEKLDPGLAGRAERLRHAVDIFQTATSRVRAEVRRRGLGDDGL